jgi:protein-L-isoaspartate(D-aspartate) O-methyltransferase
MRINGRRNCVEGRRPVLDRRVHWASANRARHHPAFCCVFAPASFVDGSQAWKCVAGLSFPRQLRGMQVTKIDFEGLRNSMVDRQVAGRGVRSHLVLDAMRIVPREAFLPERLQEFAYEDAPLPIAEGQTISQPYIVALMIDALGLEGGEEVLEIGTGSGYAAAVLSRIARDVYTVERIGQLAEKAAAVLAKLRYANVHVLHADGTRGWPDHAPYDAIVVAAGGPDVPESLKAQLKIGGRLVIPVGIDRRVQELLRVTRVSERQYEKEDIADVRFVPLVGDEGWAPEEGRPVSPTHRPPAKTTDEALAKAIRTSCESFEDLASADLERLLHRIGDARVVLLGEATHGTSEFYRMRERISRELIERKGFSFIAIEGDWPDAARVDHYVRHAEYPPSEWTAFARFPVWMWRNQEVRQFVDWLRARNATVEAGKRVAFHGLDLYSLYNSIRSVLNYLEDVDPQTARVARERYGCLTPWQGDPATYGHAALTGAYQTCEREVVTMLLDLMEKRHAYAEHDGERFLDAVQNARLVANAERYYRTMYYGSRASWNLRDGHMFETLKTLLSFHGPASKAIVWAHNSHIGDSAATEMSSRGEYNIGHLCRKEFGNAAYSIGFGTNSGTVAAASDWDGPMEIKAVRPALPRSYERLCHDAECPQFLLPLRSTIPTDLAEGLSRPRLERAIGVIYRPKTELESHYFQAILPHQFDEYVWFDETKAITPLRTDKLEGLPDTYPFGL